jgi:TPP-dependent pyruvate/acetoin dehydrogenase alpha subunit/F0F1-type ATP synthase membrane subunit c/vacuolar-type H+-ATPase subunit K
MPDQEAKAEAPTDRHTPLGLKEGDLVAMYRTLLLARILDQKVWNLNRTGKARFVIPGQGQEAAQVGSAWALRRGQDIVLPYYRDVGVVLTMGMTPYEVVLNVLAKPEDPNSGGRQMPYHWGSRRLGVITQSSPIGTQLPHAAGLAKAAQIRGDDDVTVCYFGEATASKGDFHEALNFAGIHRLPAVFICENNLYAISVPMSLQSAVSDIADHAPAYGFEGAVVDGNDVLDVFAATSAAVERARAGGGPSLVECKTYRLLPHTSDDDDKAYRSAEEVEAWRRKDPIPRMRAYLLGHGLLTAEADAALEKEVRAEVDEAAKRAEESAEAVPEMAFEHVYARPARAIRGAPSSVNERLPRPQARPHPGSGVERSVLETVRSTLDELMADDDRIVVLGEDVGLLGGVFRATQGLHARYGPSRVIDTPLAESAIVGIGIGLGLIGFAALNGIARQPEQAGAIQGVMYVIAGLVEGAGIISLVLCLVTIFV